MQSALKKTPFVDFETARFEGFALKIEGFQGISRHFQCLFKCFKASEWLGRLRLAVEVASPAVKAPPKAVAIVKRMASKPQAPRGLSTAVDV